jgi:hypothetical protein
MVKKLYIDGCSMTYGYGLSRTQSLGHLFHEDGGYEVLDMSRPGKSNMSIAVDVYKHYKNYDAFVIGWTYSNRFGIRYRDQNIDFFSGFQGNQRNHEPHALDQAFVQVYKFFYTVFEPPFCDDLSDMMIDGTLSFLSSQGKEVRAFSWEHRNITNKVHYPYIGPHLRLDDGHLNSEGTKELYNFLQNLGNHE